MLYVLLTCAVALGNFVPPVLAQENSVFEDEGEYEIILEVKRRGKILSKAIIGMEKEFVYFLPLTQIARLVNFEVSVNLDAQSVEGTFGGSDNQYKVDIGKGTFTLRGAEQALPEGAVYLKDKGYGVVEFYATPQFINDLWGLELDLDTLKQRLDLTTKKDLPFELAEKRRLKRDSIFSSRKYNQKREAYDPSLPYVPNEYKFFSKPSLNINTTINETTAEKTNGSQSLNVTGRGDIFKTEANYTLRLQNSKDRDGSLLEEARIRLERKSYDGSELPFNLKLFQAGDINVKAPNLIEGSLSGRGVMISNVPAKQNRDFDTVTVEGFAEPGWEVELYRGKQLLEFDTVGSDGEYRFEDVTLNYFKTVLRVVLYGPQGQIEEREEVYNVSRDMLRPGEEHFSATILDNEKDLISINDENELIEDSGIAGTFRYSRGINKWLSTFGTFTKRPTEQGNKNYATIGLNLSLLGASGTVEAYKDFSGGSAVDVRAATQFFGINANARAAFMSDFESEATQFGANNETKNLEFSLSRSFKLPFGSMALSTGARHDSYIDSPSRTTFTTAQSLAVDNLQLTNSTNTQYQDGDRTGTTGRFNLNYRFNPKLTLRSYLNYALHPEWDLRNLNNELRYVGDEGLTAALSVDRNLNTTGTNIGVQLGKDFDTWRGSVDLDRTPDNDYRAVLRTSFSMTPYGPNGDYIYSSQNKTNRGNIRSRIFLDKNYDLEYNEGDEPLEDVQVKIGKRKTSNSNALGVIGYAGGISNDGPESVVINESSLPDPYYQPAVPGYNTIIRPGPFNYFEFPIHETGSIDGIVTVNNEPFSGLSVVLKQQDGTIKDTAITEFDGYYAFEFVKPGKYYLELDETHNQLFVAPRFVSVTSEDLYHVGVDLHVHEQAGEVACTFEESQAGDDGRITHPCHDTALSSLVQDWTKQSARPLVHSEEFAMVNQVRIGEHSGHVRVALDLSAPVDFDILEQENSKYIRIKLKNVIWNDTESWEAEGPALVKAMEVDTFKEGEAIIYIQGSRNIRLVSSYSPENTDNEVHQLVFEISE